MLVTTDQTNPHADADKEAWIETLESMPVAPSAETYEWLYKTFRATVAANSAAKAVHFNYVRYQGAKLPPTERKVVFEIIDWVERQVEAPGFDWNNLLMHFSISAHA